MYRGASYLGAPYVKCECRGGYIILKGEVPGKNVGQKGVGILGSHTEVLIKLRW